MRITNKIIQNNSLYNINTNKVLEDRLNTMMATGKKITRPSDDPVIAIRALRLRSSLADITQYNDKNAEDATSWLDVTEGSLETIYTQLEDMYEQCQTGVNKYYSTENRNAIVTALKELRDAVYDAGNADYAGRSVFTGYRTGMTLTFEEQTTQQYTITEQVTAATLDEVNYIRSMNVTSVNAGNYTASTLTEQDIDQASIHRIRLAHNQLDTGVDVSETKVGQQDIMFTYYDPVNGKITFGDDSGEIDTMSLYGTTNPYEAMAAYNDDPANATKDKAIFIPETGELLLSTSLFGKLNETQDKSQTLDTDEGRISIIYSKTNWEKSELRPEHYFYCESNGIKYNEEKLGVSNTRQDICYDMGANQNLQVNTLADECIVHAIGRDVDDIVNAIEDVQKMEETIASLKTAVPDNETEQETLQRTLDAANKALTFLQDKLKNLFEGGITKMQEHMDRVVLAQTDLGTRGAKLDLVKKRLSSEKTTFKELVKTNEQANTAEVATDLATAELAYDSALMATSKVIQNSLMNYL